MTETNIVGGWTAFDFTLSKEATEVFEKALKGLMGVRYTPLAVATQVVAGVNYCFLCKGEVASADPSGLAVKLYIFKPLQGSPHISQIEKIEP